MILVVLILTSLVLLVSLDSTEPERKDTLPKR